MADGASTLRAETRGPAGEGQIVDPDQIAFAAGEGRGVRSRSLSSWQ